MADAQIEPHGHLWHIFYSIFGIKLRTHHHTTQWRLVHYGFWSSAVFAVLMGLEVYDLNPFESFYVLIMIVYLLFQLVEIISRDALDWGDVVEGTLFALVPSIIGLFALFRDVPMMTPVALKVMLVWTTVAWTCLIFGLGISIKMTTVPFRRTDSAAPSS